MSRVLLALVAALCLASLSSALSIESTPVKVTHRNSGPRYDLDEEVDRSKLTPVSQTAPAADNKQQEDGNKDTSESAGDQDSPVGHISIRRIFLVPVMRPSRPDWQEEAAESNERAGPEAGSQERPNMFAKPFWPFLTPARHAQPAGHHLLGADEASRSPPANFRPLFHRAEEKAEREGEPDSEASGEPKRADSGERQPEPLIDPIQMMLEMMQQAINGQLAPPPPMQQPNSPDLNKEASSSETPAEPEATSSQERPKVPTELAKKPAGMNETREDIVEIEGKKYLRKSVINRHVGENIIFMTRRLIFVPLNETEPASGEQPAASTTVAPTSEPVPNEESRTSTEKPAEEVSTTSTTTSTTAAPTTTATVEPTTPSEQENSTKESIAERVAEAIGKVERLMEAEPSSASTTTSSTTEKPANN